MFGIFKKKPKGNELSDEDRKAGQERSRKIRSLKSKLKELELAQEVYLKQEEVNAQIQNLNNLQREKELDILEREQDLKAMNSDSPEDEIMSNIFQTVMGNFQTHQSNKAQSTPQPVQPIQTEIPQDNPQDTENEEPSQAEDFISLIENMPKDKYKRVVKMIQRFT